MRSVYFHVMHAWTKMRGAVLNRAPELLLRIAVFFPLRFRGVSTDLDVFPVDVRTLLQGRMMLYSVLIEGEDGPAGLMLGVARVVGTLQHRWEQLVSSLVGHFDRWGYLPREHARARDCHWPSLKNASLGGSASHVPSAPICYREGANERG